MSGGSYEYKYRVLEELADEIENYSTGHAAERKEVAAIMRVLAGIAHDIEWIDSADYVEDDWKDVVNAIRSIRSPLQAKCLRGEHEQDGRVKFGGPGATITGDLKEEGIWYDIGPFCKHCRCLYVEKP